MVEIVLEELPYVKVTVDREWLLKKLSEVYSSEQINQLSSQSGLPSLTLANMTVIAFLKSDIANKDVMGYKRYQARLKNEGFDV